MLQSLKDQVVLVNLFTLKGVETNSFETTHPARDVPGTSPEGPNIQYLQGTFRGLLKDQQKNWWFDEKSVF